MMLGFLMGLINPFERVITEIAKAKVAAANAQTDRERIAAEERAKALETKRDVLAAEASSGVNVLARAFLMLPVGILLWKVLAYDKALGQWTGGHTDALDGNLWWVITVVLGFYFLADVAKKVWK